MSGTGRPLPLVAQNVHKRFRRKIVLSDANLEVRSGQVVALVGENGAGKTTLLRICAGLISADSGQIDVHGRVGYCPQEPGVLDLLTAEEHLVYFGVARGLSRDRALNDGKRLLAELNFPLDQQLVVKELSGGTRQKLNLGLALLGDPLVLLLDEPYQGFDRGVYLDFWDHVNTWRAQGRAVVIVTHLLAELDRVDHVVELRVHRQPAHDSVANA